MSDETDALSDMGYCQEVDELFLEQKVQEMEGLYNMAKVAPAGAKVLCPNCRVKFTKKTKNQVFCSNQRQVKGKSSCKDQYWNTVNDRKRAYVTGEEIDDDY